MRETDVPQEGNATLAGQRKVVYARQDDGAIGRSASRGWEVEEIVTRQAVDEFLRLAEEARRDAERGTASPLAFHMYKGRMDLQLLAQTTGLWRWRIRRHFRPDIFAGLPDSILQRYADALGIGIDVLRRID